MDINCLSGWLTTNSFVLVYSALSIDVHLSRLPICCLGWLLCCFRTYITFLWQTTFFQQPQNLCILTNSTNTRVLIFKIKKSVTNVAFSVSQHIVPFWYTGNNLIIFFPTLLKSTSSFSCHSLSPSISVFPLSILKSPSFYCHIHFILPWYYSSCT